MTEPELFRYVGDPAQLYGLRDCRLLGGKADGMRAVELYNQTGLRLTVLPDRGMDLTGLHFRGQNLSVLSKTGLTSSCYFREDGAKGFFSSFFAGFLTTCGLTYLGAPAVEEGEALGLHGVISNTPAEEVCAWVEEPADGAPLLRVCGKVRQARVFGEYLVLHRQITMGSAENVITLTDTVRNAGFERAPFMLLYHINLGYPLLSPSLRLTLPSRSVTPRDDDACVAEHLHFTEPTDGCAEQVFFHDLAEVDGIVTILAENPDLQTAVSLSYSKAALPCLTQWNCQRSGEYALGLEPGNCQVLGRPAARADGSLRYLEPGESAVLRLTVRVLSSAEEIRQERDRAKLVGLSGRLTVD